MGDYLQWGLEPVGLNAVTVNPATKSSGTTATTAQASALAIASITQRNITVTADSWSNSFVEASEVADANSVIYTASKVLSATGTQGTTATFNAALGRSVGLIAVFKAAGGGGPDVTQFYKRRP